MKRHSYEGPTHISYRLQPGWYDHEFAGLPYEVEKLIEALDAVGGTVFNVWYMRQVRAACGHVEGEERCNVKSEYYPVPVPEL
jgi:hypothetical protein